MGRTPSLGLTAGEAETPDQLLHGQLDQAFVAVWLLLLQIGKLREQFVGLIQVEHEVDQHKAALGQLQYDYQPSLEKTDFSDSLQEHMQQAQANDG